jgi:hypothetical protein
VKKSSTGTWQRPRQAIRPDPWNLPHRPSLPAR